jgi:hypothetical protein
MRKSRERRKKPQISDVRSFLNTLVEQVRETKFADRGAEVSRE